ncbi:MAG: ABC transporter ATP-binding protein [Chloroherpetonaceae bacterium]|nr:ABC transporter ATP-binding protein [Chloroherpetonaceae bacterium]
MNTLLSLQGVRKVYQTASGPLTVLDTVNFSIEAGESVAIVGPSGSGKTTLLGLAAGLDRVTEGSIELCGSKLELLDEDGRGLVRNRFVGFVFQNFQLVPTLTALENVTVPLELRGERNVEPFAKELLTRVGLQERFHHYPLQLSGGEQQRVAIARAFINRPQILFADEPTGNLDTETGEKITDLLFDLNKTSGTTLVLVTHNHELASLTSRIMRIKAGKMISDEMTARAKAVEPVNPIGENL